MVFQEFPGFRIGKIIFQPIYGTAPRLPSYRSRSYPCCLDLRLALAALNLMISRLAVLVLLFPFLMRFLLLASCLPVGLIICHQSAPPHQPPCRCSPATGRADAGGLWAPSCPGLTHRLGYAAFNQIACFPVLKLGNLLAAVEEAVWVGAGRTKDIMDRWYLNSPR